MGRTIKEIYEAIVDEKDNLTQVQNLAPSTDTVDQLQTDLNSDSKVAIWRLFTYTISVAHYTIELLFDALKVEINALVAKAPTGTLAWYQLQVLAFQFGDTLNFIDQKYVYSTIDPVKQIVKLCAVEDRIDGVVVIKVAKLDSNNLPIPLTAVEKTALEGYVSKIRFAGTRFFIVSSAPDLLKLIARIYFDPILDEAVVRQNVEAAIDAYIKNLPFNGVFKINALIDAVQAVKGVTDMEMDTIEAKYGALAYAAVQRTYIAQAGYLDIDPAFDLTNNLTYLPSTL